jgi:hypothetical protein
MKCFEINFIYETKYIYIAVLLRLSPWLLFEIFFDNVLYSWIIQERRQ